MCLGGEAVGLLSGGSPVRILWGLLRAHRFPMHVYVHYFGANLVNLNGFQAKMRQKRIENASKSPCFFYSGGGKI